MSYLNGEIFDLTTGGSVATTFAANSGSNRIVGILLSHEQTNGTRPLTGVSLGGATAVYKDRAVTGTAGYSYKEFWYILEADIASIGANPTLTTAITSGGSNVVSGLIFAADGVDQTHTNWTTASGLGDASAAVSASLTTDSGWLVVGGMTASGGGSGFTVSSPASSEIASPVTDRNFNGTGSRTVNFQTTASGATTTLTGDSGLSTSTTSQVIFGVGLPPPAADVTPPTVSSITVAADGTTVTLAMSEDVVIGAGGSGGLTFSASGGATILTYASGSGTSSLVYTSSRTIGVGETITASYTQPGNGIEDEAVAGNDLATFSGTAVTNDSTQVTTPTETELLDAPVLTVNSSPTDFTISAGIARRAFVLVLHAHSSNASPATSASLGGQPMTVLTTVDDETNTFDVCLTAFTLNETQIAAMSGTSLVITGGTYGQRSVLYWSVEGADQNVVDFASAATTGTSGSVALTRGANSYTLGVTFQDFGGSGFSGLAEPAELDEQSTTNTDIAYGHGTDTSRTANFVWTHSTSRNNVTLVLNVPPTSSFVSSDPVITSTSDDTPTNGSLHTLVGSGFGTVQGTVKANGVNWGITSWTDTEIGVIVALGENRYYANVPLVVTDIDGTESAPYNIQIQPTAESLVVDLSGTLAALEDRVSAVPDLVNTYQLEAWGVIDGTIGDIELYEDASLSWLPANTSVLLRAHNGLFWGVPGRQTFSAIPEVDPGTGSGEDPGTGGGGSGTDPGTASGYRRFSVNYSIRG